MDIVYSSSDSYCEIAGISILSLLEHNRNVKELNLYLIDNQISAENKQKLENMIASFGRTLTYLAHPDIEKRSATEINVGRWNISTFYRLFLPSMLPETVKKVLFIDCDTLVMQDLTPLWEMDMGEKWLYGVDDCRGAAYRTNLGLQPTDNYINNGVLLVDLDAWRKNNVEDMFLRYIRENQGDITFVDQGVQNGVLSKLGRSGILHPKYNCMTVFFAFDYKNLIKLRKPPVPGDPAQYREAVENPAIVHFQSCFRMSIRPWVEGCKHPYAKTYLAYKEKSPWKDTPMKPDDRTAPQKVLSAVTSAMPERLMVDCISFVHTKIYPLARNLKQRMNRK